jgi:uncharacterized protein (TIGR02646 family)
MRQIQKDYETNVVKQHKAELKAARLDEDSLLDPANYPGDTGKKLYKYVRDIKIIPHFWDLKHQMYEEQGGICCYCGLKIFKDSNGRKMSVEHLVPKGIQRELVGEYKNLLLSCTIINDDTLLLGVNSINDSSLQHCDDSKGNAIVMLIGLVFLILAPILGKIMQMAVSRRREFLADSTAVEFTRNPDGLISALIKLDEDPNELRVANKATENMYIVNPFKKNVDKKKKASLFSTHPTIADRIEALQNIS